MIQNIGKYYLYRHIRLDKGTPFYIGVGTKSTKKPNFRSIKNEYLRGYTYHKENSIWKNVVSKTTYIVEILMESDDYNFILSKEKEFIALYGRMNLKTGILANLTDGGEGNPGRKGKPMSDDLKKIFSERMRLNNPNKDGNLFRGRPNPEASKRMKLSNPRHTSLDVWSKPCFQYDLQGNFIQSFKSRTEAELNVGAPKGKVNSCILGLYKSSTGYMWKANFEGIKIEPYIRGFGTKSVEIYNIDNNETKIFSSLKECSLYLGASTGNVCNAIKKKTICKGFYIKYYNKEENE